MSTARHRGKHCRAEENRFLGGGSHHRMTGDVGEDLTDKAALAGAAADDDGVAFDSLLPHRADHIAQSISETAKRRDEMPLEILDAFVERKAGNDRVNVRIGKR